MATETPEVAAPEGGETPKKKLPVGLILILLQSLATLGASGFAIWAVMHPPKPPVSKVELRERSISSIIDQEADLRNVNLEEFQVNAKSGGTLRTKIILEVSNSEVERVVQDKMPRVKDLIGQILTDVERKNILDIQGKLAVKNTLRNSINDLVMPLLKESNQGIVREVYLVDLMQN